ncbi:MAG: response regulator, partial [Firmicutes bacterium]|nr:response regulator [Bacillota bacterium]
AQNCPGEVFISEPYIDIVSGDMCFTVSTMLSDGVTVIGADYNFSKLQESVTRMTEGTDRTALIVTKKGMIVGYTDMSYVGDILNLKLSEYSDIFSRVTASKTHPSFRINLNGRRQTIFSSETSNQWYMILCVDNWALYRDGYRQLIINTLINLLLVIVIIVFYMMSVHNRIKSEKALEVKEEFLSGLSGELREPLNRVLKRCDMMLASHGGSQEDVTEIKESGIQLSEMFDNLFSFSSIVSRENRQIEEKKQINLPQASRLARNGVTAVLVFTLIVSQIICVYSTRGWGDSKMLNETETYENQLTEWITKQQSILSMFTNIISEHPDLMDDYDSAVKWLDGIVKNYPEISVCYMANPYKEHTVIMNNGWQPDKDWKVEERQWYKDTELSYKDSCISVPYYDEQTGNYCITMSQMVFGESGEFLGIFGIDFFMDKLINVLGESYTKTGYAFMVDSDGMIINHPNEEYQMSLNNTTSIEDTVYSTAFHSNGNAVIKDYNGSIMTCMSKKNELSGFTVIVVNRWWTVYANTVLFSLLFLFLFGMCIATVIALINRLIRWQHNANRKLEEAADVAYAAEKAQAQFMAQMSHEIRTPINAVLGMNEMILRESDNSNILDYSNNIKRAGNTLLTLINGILDFSKMESGKMEIIQARYETSELIDDVVYMMSERAQKKNLEFITEIDPNLPKTLYGDDLRIKQIISNILTNAVKYTHQGSVTLLMGGYYSDDETFNLMVSVKDTGIGIKKEDISGLFQSFKRLDEEKNRNIEGTGLGIAIVQRLLNMMDSKLDVESEYGKGSEFQFVLVQKVIDKTPVGEYHARKNRNRESEEYIPLITKNADILIVDDNDMNLKVAAGLMKRCGIVPDTAESGDQCIESVKKKHYDIIFLDHMMPDKNGIETLREMKDGGLLPNDTIVVALTANAIAGAKETYINEGFGDYLPKPIDVKVLEKMLEKYLPKDKIVSAAHTEPVKPDSETEPEPEPEIGSADTPTVLEYLEKAGINTKAGIEYSINSEEFYYEMLTAFTEGAAKKADEIKTDFETKNLTNYRTRVHALKSTAKMIGADKLSERALWHENAAKDERLEDIEADFEALLELYAETVKIIIEALRKQNKKG